MRRAFAILIVLAAVGAPLAAQPQRSNPAQAQQATREEPGAPVREEVAGPAEEKTSQTSHAIRLDGKDIKYAATAGTLPIRSEDGKVAARMFFVAYTKDGEDVRTRPVSFLYNGGPGAASIWLHMGSFSPRRVQMADDGFQPAPPYRLVDNENSLLDVTDLVFIDAVSTGYSRTVAGVSSTPFHGQQGDIRAFGNFINEYLRTYSRWPSPKFLIGESYGTIRSAGLSQELQSRHGIEVSLRQRGRQFHRDHLRFLGEQRAPQFDGEFQTPRRYREVEEAAPAQAPGVRNGLVGHTAGPPRRAS